MSELTRSRGIQVVVCRDNIGQIVLQHGLGIAHLEISRVAESGVHAQAQASLIQGEVSGGFHVPAVDADFRVGTGLGRAFQTQCGEQRGVQLGCGIVAAVFR